MEGVNILNSQLIIVKETNLWWIYLSLLFFVVSVMWCTFLINNRKTKEIYAVLSSIFAVIGICSFVFSVLTEFPTGEQYTLYQATISEEVPYKELVSKYYIIKQEGEIYTIKEKSDNNDKH